MQGSRWTASRRGYLACASSGRSFKLITAETSTAITSWHESTLGIIVCQGRTWYNDFTQLFRRR
jgi:hypothetical protein